LPEPHGHGAFFEVPPAGVDSISAAEYCRAATGAGVGVKPFAPTSCPST